MPRINNGSDIYEPELLPEVEHNGSWIRASPDISKHYGISRVRVRLHKIFAKGNMDEASTGIQAWTNKNRTQAKAVLPPPTQESCDTLPNRNTQKRAY
jgi:hypothetical protein